MEWRRLADWKHEVLLVHRAELPKGFLADHDLADPVELVRPHAPAFAEALEKSGWLRVEGDVGDRLRAADVMLTEVRYHRGSDGLELVEHGAPDPIFSVGVAELDLPEADLEALDDVVDAVLRAATEDSLPERSVLLAEAAPGLSATPDEGALRALADLDPERLPRASEDLVDRVAAAIATPPPHHPPGPVLTLDERRAYRSKALTVLVVSASASAFAAWKLPMGLVVTVPALVLAGVIVAIHSAIIAQSTEN